MQKLAEEKKAEALKQMNSMPGPERHGPDGYHGGCRDGRDGRGLPPPPHTSSVPRQHPKQVSSASGGRTFILSPAEKQQHSGGLVAMCANTAALIGFYFVSSLAILTGSSCQQMIVKSFRSENFVKF